DRELRWLGDQRAMGGPRDYSEQTAREVDVEVRTLIAAAYAEAKAILTARRADLEAGAALLLERESLTPDDFPPLKRAVEKRRA
ncbi:MAG: hypothetical protein WCC57_20000, partial [Paracoccaceae bacterium]